MPCAVGKCCSCISVRVVLSCFIFVLNWMFGTEFRFPPYQNALGYGTHDSHWENWKQQKFQAKEEEKRLKCQDQ